VHQGGAESGHYISFCYDRNLKKWFKFNDIRVMEVTEEEVMKGSEGGDSWDTAYWVVYVSEELAQLNDKSTHNLYKVP
jgi:ubiquitin C-terminal hydrolase